MSCGYTGIFQQEPTEKVISIPKNLTMYAIGDDIGNELFLVVLSIGSYTNLSSIIQNTNYNKVTITFPSIDTMFVSDLYNTINKASTMKDITWMFPKQPSIPLSSACYNSYRNSDYFINTTNKEKSITFFENKIEEGKSVYDFIISTGNKVIYISNYLTNEKLQELLNDITIDEVHIPYSITLYGGLSYLDIIYTHKYNKKIFANSFSSFNDYIWYVNKGGTLPSMISV